MFYDCTLDKYIMVNDRLVNDSKTKIAKHLEMKQLCSKET